MRLCGLDSSGLGQRDVADSCRRSNERKDSMECEEFG